MGGSKPSSPKKIKPTTYQQVNPLMSYQQAASYLAEARKQTNQAMEARYQETGTPAELGARNLGMQAKEAATYLSSLPSPDKYLQDVTGSTNDPYAAVKSQAATNLSNAQAAYVQALQKVGEKPAKLDENYVPEWSKQTIKAGMPVTTT